MITEIKTLVNFFAEPKGINQTVLAGRTLAGNNGTDKGACSAGQKPVFVEIFDELGDVGIVNTLNFQGQSGSHRNFAASELFRSLSNDVLFRCGNFTVFGNDTHIENIRITLVLQAAQALHSFNFFRREFPDGVVYLHGVKKCAALQYLCVRITVIFQTILQEISPFASRANKKQLFILANALDLSVHFSEIHPSGAENLCFRLHINDTVSFCFTGKIFRRRNGLKIAVHFILQHIAGLNKGMNGGGEGRRVCHVHGIKIAYFQSCGNSDNGNVRHFVHGSAADYLHAEQFACVFIGNQLRRKYRGIRIIMCLVIADTNNGFDIITGVSCLLLGKTGSAGTERIGEFYNAGSETAAVCAFASGECFCQTSCRNIRGGTHSRPLRVACDTIFHNGTVPDGIDVNKICLLILVNNNRALYHFNAGAFEEGSSRTDTDA